MLYFSFHNIWINKERNNEVCMWIYLYVYQVSYSTLFFFVSYMPIFPLYGIILLEVGCSCFPGNELFKHDVVRQSFICLRL